MRFVVGLMVAATALLATDIAQACRCAPPPEPKKALEKSTAVFLGKVIDIDATGRFGLNVTFEIQTNYKNAKTKKVTVRTATNSAACGYPFTKGEVYLVYCSGKPESLSTNTCTRTRRASAAKEDLAALGAGVAAID